MLNSGRIQGVRVPTTSPTSALGLRALFLLLSRHCQEPRACHQYNLLDATLQATVLHRTRSRISKIRDLGICATGVVSMITGSGARGCLICETNEVSREALVRYSENTSSRREREESKKACCTRSGNYLTSLSKCVVGRDGVRGGMVITCRTVSGPKAEGFDNVRLELVIGCQSSSCSRPSQTCHHRQ